MLITMKKVLLFVLIGIAVSVVLAVLHSPEIIPTDKFKQMSGNYDKCPEPFVFQMPVDINKATSILYPGQIRGGNYKAHGGFRFDKSRPDEIAVKAPYDAKIISGARYPVNGEIQYTFDFEHPCGIRYRFGHLLTLAPKLQAIAEKFPLPKEADSRTTQVSPPIEVKQGEVIATAVGLTRGGPEVFGGLNTFVDWGAYDYRRQNEASQDSDWASAHSSEDSDWNQYYNSETYKYAVCWLDWISAEDKAKVSSLPSADTEHGKESDFCK